MRKRMSFCVFLIVLLIAFSGCSSGGDDDTTSDDTVPRNAPRSASFSPVTAADADGNNVPLYWKYSVNSGNPLAATDSGMSLNLSCNELTVTINPNELRRTVSVGGNVSGDASGSFTVDAYEDIVIDGTATFIENQVLDFNIFADVGNDQMELGFHVLIDFEGNAQWFPDRTDLDELGVGYVYDEQGQVACNIEASINLAYNDKSLQAEDLTAELVSPERWEIVDALSDMTVLDKTYNNIMVVERQTVMPSNAGDYGAEAVTITYWIAKGIGTIKSEGEFRMYGQPVVVELAETNLVQ